LFVDINALCLTLGHLVVPGLREAGRAAHASAGRVGRRVGHTKLCELVKSVGAGAIPAHHPEHMPAPYTSRASAFKLLTTSAICPLSSRKAACISRHSNHSPLPSSAPPLPTTLAITASVISAVSC
jgi:hypothetical protein